MKIAIPTNGNSLEDEIALHFGRAKNFLIFDTENKNFEVFENPELKGKELPPDFLNRLGVKAVIAFGLGPMAFRKFKNYDIKMLKATKGKIKENIQKFENKELNELGNEDIF